MKDHDIPPKLRTFIALGFDFHRDRLSGSEAYGDCIFCGKHDKLYINIDTGQWSCKAGSCQESGNVYSFIQLWYKMVKENGKNEDQSHWIALANDRQIAPEDLKEVDIVYDQDCWYLPIKNSTGALINLKKFKIGENLKGLPELEHSLFGVEALSGEKNHGDTLFICEGEWDAICMRVMLNREGREGVVVGSPGSGVWKDSWSQICAGRDVVICFDNDLAGEKGTKRVFRKISSLAASVSYIKWPTALPTGFDIRDFVSRGGTWEELKDLTTVYVDKEEEDASEEAAASQSTDKMPLTMRPKFEEVLSVFTKHLHMTEDMTTALRIIMAVVLSNQVDGDPLWVHIVSPPGTAKTLLLSPLAACPSCYFASTLTAHSLVSGFATQGGGDPSLIPKLNGKTLVLKDFTEILGMPRVNKDEIYATLRGAYDGQVDKTFGNGLHRHYKVKFNMISGVTHAIFGERSASVGERFLIFHLVKGVGFDSTAAIKAAMRNVGNEEGIKTDLQEIVKRFVEVKIDPTTIPIIPEDMLDKIAALAGLVAILRANVEKVWSPGQEKVMYRPQHEMGTRLAKELTKLAYGLAMVNTPFSLGKREYRVVSRVALDTCIGFNLELVSHLVANEGGKFIEELSDVLDLSISTLRDQLDDMAMLGAVVKEKVLNPHGRGAPRYLYHASPTIVHYWTIAELTENPDVLALSELREISRGIKRVRKVSVPQE